MPKIPATLLPRRRGTAALGALLAVIAAAWLPATASASHSQLAIIQDGNDLTSPASTILQFRALGANTIRVIVPWATLAPAPLSTKKPATFNATDPNDYPAGAWAPYDAIVQDAAKDGLTVDFTVTGGAPRWAEASALPKGSTVDPLFTAWEPNAAAYGQFVQAVGTRYDGHFVPAGGATALPKVHFWAIFNEVNFGEDLGPQATDGSTVATGPMMYRSLLNAGWNALQATGHGHDTILIDEFAARGIAGPPTSHAPQGYPGNYAQTKPLIFLRALYCVNADYQQLRGSAAAAIGCPTTAAGSRSFRAQNPGLFNASGVGDHPYPGNQDPLIDGNTDPNFATFPDLGHLESALDRLNRIYGSSKQFPIYNDEYGYITDPPATGRVAITGGHYVSPATAAYYINWAEYLSWKSPRTASYMQYLLEDPAPSSGPYAGFASGLETFNGKQKATYDAYRLPVYMPTTTFSHTSSQELWGAVRPAPFIRFDGDGIQKAAIQLNGTTISTVSVTGAGGYFDVRLKFPKSGTVRLAWTYPKLDPLVPITDLGKTVYSRSFTVTVH
jgi:hypothetical protein